MEFLLQLIADFIGTPVEEEEKALQEKSEKITLESSVETESSAGKEIVTEEPILFGLMQFH
ncbi:MAG: hypothetical protein R6U46_09215 [Marinilabilia sp.]